MDEALILKDELKESEKMISQLNKELAALKSKAKLEKNNSQLFQENIELDREHKNNLRDIDDYKSQLNEIESRLKSQRSELDALIKENETLKYNIKKKSENMSQEKKIKDIKDLKKAFGFFLKDLNQKKLKEIEKKKKEEKEDLINEEKEFEKLKKLKGEKEILLNKMFEEIISYDKEADNEITYNNNFRDYIDSISNQINSFKQQLGISIVGGINFNFGKMTDNNADLIMKEVEETSFIISQTDDFLYIIKNRILKKAENILRDVQTAKSEINKNKNLDYRFLSIKMDLIQNKMDDLKKLGDILKGHLSDICKNRSNIDSKIKSLKKNLENLMNDYKEAKKKINQAILKVIRKKRKNIFSSINKSLRKEKVDEDDKMNEEIYDDIVEKENDDDDDYNLQMGTTLIKIKDFGKKMDLYKSTALFYNKNEANENSSKQPQLLNKNWNEIVYIYDDYDIHDINFEIKAVGLSPLSSFTSSSNGFYMRKDIEIIDFEINGKKSNYNFYYYFIVYSINLKNLQTAKIHLKYKESHKMEKSEKSVYSFYRKEYYGLNDNLHGQMGKIRIILKGNFEIVSFKDDFFIRNENNKKEKEYIWGGKIPAGGKRTLVSLSKNEAIWSFNFNARIISGRKMTKTTLFIPIGLVGGNNDIIKLDYSSPQTKDIVVDEIKRRYEINYINTGYFEGNFILTGEIKNRCVGDWDVDLTDDTIENSFPIEDKRDKQKLAQIARDIIDEFDRKNKDNMFSYMDFTKIGKWVHDNIKYDLKYTTKTEMTAMDIYNQRVGVCHHMTRLANALLYSLGYKVIYINGYACDSSPEFDRDCAHAWSLIKVKEKWYPFDATWNILSGKLPVCHVFNGFFGNKISVIGKDDIIFFQYEDNGKFIK
mgnify:CR=1 FL=1